MGDVIDYDDAFIWSINRLSDCFGMTYRTIKRRLREHDVRPAGFRSGHPIYRLSEAVPAILKATGTPSVNFEEQPEARKAWYQSENERLKFEKQLSQLVERADAVMYTHFLTSIFCSHLDLLKRQLRSIDEISGEALELSEELLDGLQIFVVEQSAKFD